MRLTHRRSFTLPEWEETKTPWRAVRQPGMDFRTFLALAEN